MINAYLRFEGNTEEVFNFYKSALKGKIKRLERFGYTPHGEHMSETDKQKIMHVTLEMPDGSQLMGNDHLEMMGGPFQAGNNFSLAVHPENEDEARAVFSALSEGGAVTMPLEKTFWGAFFGMLTDKFGVQWMINYEENESK